MDIVTHGLLGAAIAVPLAGSQPEAALAFMMGSALPDLDALSRLLGRRAFLACHQTVTHSAPGIAAAAAAAALLAHAAGLPALPVATGLGAGMALHSLLDYTNTYGVAVWSPFSASRSCREWIFFIDAPMILLTLPCLLPAVWGSRAPACLALGLLAALSLYVAGRARLKARALSLAPVGTASLLPVFWPPWCFLGAARDGARVDLFALNARSGALTEAERIETLDAQWEQALCALPEFRAMRRVSPLYHVVSASQEEGQMVLICQDLRTRQFKARFGELRVAIGPGGRPVVRDWRL